MLRLKRHRQAIQALQKRFKMAKLSFFFLFFTAFFSFFSGLSEEERIEGQVFCFSFYGFFCIYLFEKGETH